MTIDKARIATNLRRILDERGWAPADLAREMGVGHAPNTVYRIVRGDNAPSIGTLAKLADALGVPVEDFLADSKNRRRNA